MKKTSLHLFLGWIAIFTFAFISSTETEARRFQVNNAIQYSASNELAPTIKVEEYRYLEEKVVQRNSEHSIFDLIFGESTDEGSMNSKTSVKSRGNRILLPKMVGGLPALFANIEYPNQAKANEIEGIVKVEFTVNELGMVEEIKIIEGIGGGCDEEVINALKKTRFSPAIQNGRFVKVKLSQSILFELKPLR